MKRVIFLTGVFLASALFGQAREIKDPKFLEKRKSECEKLSHEYARHAAELEQKAQTLEDDAGKALADLAKLKREESENFSELAEAFGKKQWNTIARLEKKSGKLCEEWSEKWAKFEKKSGGDLKEKKASREKSYEKSPEKVYDKSGKPDAFVEKESSGKPNFQKISEQAQGLGAP